MKPEVDHITGQILDACIKIHNVLGPGLFESVYEQVLLYELIKRGFSVHKQKALPLVYDDIKFEDGFRVDLEVEGVVIVEIKSLEQLSPVHYKQLQTYLKLSNVKNGLLINFNVLLMKEGFHRVFNNHLKR
ncbi:MAG: GxxExxY protein [Chitinophagaceae bacterium]|nr:MAG: GxxExxY protein [Chitinophagaceae bacterium]